MAFYRKSVFLKIFNSFTASISSLKVTDFFLINLRFVICGEYAKGPGFFHLKLLYIV